MTVWNRYLKSTKIRIWWSGIIAQGVLIRMALSKADVNQNNTDIKSTTWLYDQWKVLQCWPWTGHLPSFFVTAAGHGSSSVHPQQRNAYAMPGGSPGGGGGMLGGVGSPKIDWYIIVALLLIQALVEDQVHHPNDLGAQAIAITDNEDQEPIHSPNQITAVLNLVPVCSTPEGRRQNPCLLYFFFFEGFEQKLLFFFCSFMLSHMSPAFLAGCYYCFHNLNASFWTVTHSLALRLIQIALSLE